MTSKAPPVNHCAMLSPMTAPVQVQQLGEHQPCQAWTGQCHHLLMSRTEEACKSFGQDWVCLQVVLVELPDAPSRLLLVRLRVCLRREVCILREIIGCRTPHGHAARTSARGTKRAGRLWKDLPDHTIITGRAMQNTGARRKAPQHLMSDMPIATLLID